MITKQEFIRARNDYILRKHEHEEIEKKINEIDEQITAKHGFSGLSWTIGDDEAGEKIAEEMQVYLDETGLQDKVNELMEAHRTSERAFARACLGLMPDVMKEQRDILINSIDKNYTVRMKIIENGMRLDINTIPSVA
jgi:hypothetical protein